MKKKEGMKVEAERTRRDDYNHTKFFNTMPNFSIKKNILFYYQDYKMTHNLMKNLQNIRNHFFFTVPHIQGDTPVKQIWLASCKRDFLAIFQAQIVVRKSID